MSGSSAHNDSLVAVKVKAIETLFLLQSLTD